MFERAIRGVAGAALLFPGSVLAQGVTIDHKAVGCIVAEKFPKMSACFSPASQLARARVYFRPEEGPPSWYYVEMKADAPCHAGVLPKPRKELIGKRVLYYVNAFDDKFVENRTADNEVLVVKSESECKKEEGAAPIANSGPTGVFPGVPAGFAGAGLGTGAMVAAVAGGAAVVGGGVALATSGGNNNSSPPPTTAAVVATVPATVPPPTPTTQPPTPFNAVFKVMMGGVQQSSPINLPFFNPFTAQQVDFNMCDSTGPGKLTYNVDVNLRLVTNFPFPVPPPPGFPKTLGGKCDIPITFTPISGITTPFDGLKASSFFSISFVYDVRMRVETANSAGNSPKDHEDFEVQMPFDPCFVIQIVGCGAPLKTSVPEAARPGAQSGRIDWASQLDVAEAAGQVVVNGSVAAFAGPGRSTALAAGRHGENRIEAQIVQGAGKPGTWRFELGTTAGLVPGSLRVVSGTVAEVTGDAVVFRLSGRPGERVVFSFRIGE